ncbi:MAG: HYC_CC_PP family protein [Bacteroidota bacterium]
MQKVINIAFSFLLLISISGISINQHFCKEQIVDVHAAVFSFGEQKTYECCENPAPTCDGEEATCNINEENSGCPFCHNEEKELKIKDYFVTADFNFTFVQQAEILNTTSYRILDNPLFIDQFHNPYSRFIPPDTRTSLSFLNRYLL